MNILLLLIFISALPVFLFYLWLRLSRFFLPLHWFLLFLLAGTLSLLAALVLQRLLPDTPPGAGGTGWLFYTIFCKAALAEETGRFLVLLAFFRISSGFSAQSGGGGFAPRFRRSAEPGPDAAPGRFWGMLAGLVAGLGFAAVENASYGAADAAIALIRAFTAAPLHGACGARAGAAAAGLRESPFPSLLSFLSAVANHGMYNFMILLGPAPRILAIFTAFTALASSILFIRAGLKNFDGSRFRRKTGENGQIR
ncbi:MAG: PrsW family intramembrane metalloprotease [Treponema sp.]|jgi:RsiW-degrading membrane proteinase PrsW (M82 family)|nr:PrsW family intramembrane metalloprotease [Treponema sp.]